MSGCGNNGPIEGGFINHSTVANSTIQGSAINGSVISASSLQTVTSVDDASALVIANAIAKLSTEELRALAKAICDAMPLVEVAAGPSSSVKDSLPTEIWGGRQAILGSPSGWLRLRGVVVPAYVEGA